MDNINITIPNKVDPNFINQNSYSPAYWQMRPKWVTALDLYEPTYGGGGYQAAPSILGSYLTRHPKEDDAEFGRRAARVSQVNVLKMVIDFYCAMLFSTSIRITSDTHKDEVDSFVKMCNKRGDTLEDFYREQVTPQAFLYGVVDTFVDLPRANQNVTSKAQQDSLGLTSPYCFLVPPLNRVRWQINDADQYTYYQSEDKIDTEINPSFQIKHKEQYQSWTADWVTVFGKDGTVLSQVANPFGFIPAVTVIPDSSIRFYRDKIGKSIVDGLVELQREILNTMSEISDYHTSINFALLTIIQDMDEGAGDVADEGEVKELGSNRIMGLKGKGTRIEYVMPDPSGVKAMQDYLDTLIDKCMKSAYIPTNTTDIKTHTSAQTIRTNQAVLYNKLTALSRQLAKSMKQTVEMALRVQGIDPVEANVKVEWETSFSNEAFSIAIEEFTAFRSAVGDMSETAVRELAKKVSASALYGTGQTDSINKEIDAWTNPTPEPAAPAPAPLPTTGQLNSASDAAIRVAEDK